MKIAPCFAAIAFFAVSTASAKDWLQLQNGPGHPGYTDETIGKSFTLLWRSSPGAISPNVQPIVVAARVIVGTAAGDVVAFDALSGAQAWKATTRGAIRGSAASDGTRVFVGSADRTLYAFDAATGTALWQQRMAGPIKAAPVVDGGFVYVAANRGGLVKLDAATGTVVYVASYDFPIFVTPAVDAGRVFVLGADARLRGLDAATGQEQWATQLVGQTPGSGWVAAGAGRVFGAVRSWMGFPNPISDGTTLIDDHALEPWALQRDVVIAMRSASPWNAELWELGASDGIERPLPVPTAWRAIGDIMHMPVIVASENAANLAFRFSAGEHNTTGGGATVIEWGQHLGALDFATNDFGAIDNGGSMTAKTGEQAMLISDEGWSFGRAGRSFVVQSWHGLYGMDVDTHTAFPILLQSRAQASGIMDSAKVVLFDTMAAESCEGGGGVPPAFSSGVVYYQTENQLVALRGTP